MKTFFCFFFSFFLTVSIVYSQGPVRIIPSFRFANFNGTPFTHHDVKNGKVSIFYYFDINCSHCQTTMKLFAGEYNNLLHVNFYLVSLDQPEPVLKFMSIYANKMLNKRNVFLLQDVNQQFVQKFNPLTYPAVFLFNQNKQLLIYQDKESQMYKLISKAKTYKP